MSAMSGLDIMEKLIDAANGVGLTDDEYVRRLEVLNENMPELAEALRQFVAFMSDGRRTPAGPAGPGEPPVSSPSEER